MREKGPELFRIDPDRVALVGDSAGGYLTLMGGFCVKPRPKALVSFYGYGDITGKWTSRPDPHYLKRDRIEKEEAYKVVGGKVLSGSPIFPRVTFYNYCRQNGLWPKEVAALDPDTEPEKLERFCPVRHVTKEYPPTLLLHGDKDTDVPFEDISADGRGPGAVSGSASAHPHEELRSPSESIPRCRPSTTEPPRHWRSRSFEAFDAVLAF